MEFIINFVPIFYVFQNREILKLKDLKNTEIFNEMKISSKLTM